MKMCNKQSIRSLLLLVLLLILAVAIVLPGQSLAIQPQTATLHVIKHVVNENGGTAVAANFTLHVRSSGVDVTGSPALGVEAPGITYTLPPGTYVINENPYNPRYYATYSGLDDLSGKITLIAGDNKTVTITNYYMSDEQFDGINGPVPKPTAMLSVIKHVINDNGGAATANDFMLHVRNNAGVNVGGSPKSGVESPGTTYILFTGAYKITEDAVFGYTASYSGDANAEGNVTLNEGEIKTVTITNNDDPPLPVSKATLHVIKHVINDDGGKAAAGDFNLHVKQASGMGFIMEVDGSPALGAESPGTTYILDEGTYKVSEDAFAGYIESYSGDVDANGIVTLNPGDEKTVLITNNDDPLGPNSRATLHVIKQVINDDGGKAVASDFNLHVKKVSGLGVGPDVLGSPAKGAETPGTTYILAKGTYQVSEDAFVGYTLRYSGDTDANGNITLKSGDNKTITLINDDNKEGDIPDEEEDPNDKPDPQQSPPPIKVVETLDFTYGYINGYTTGSVGINDSLTREQVSASLYRILKQAGKIIGYTKPAVSDFSDLATNRWSYAAIEYMVSIGAIPKGNTVKPLEPVTRGEMAKIIAITNKMTDKKSALKFPDLPASHKYYDYVNMIVNYGLIVGYPNGLIKPDGLITRSEYITMINRFIGRDNRYDVSGLKSLYKDLPSSHWAFTDIQRASFGFTTQADENGLFQVDPAMGISKADLDN